MDAQEIFDTVCEHLAKQGRRAINADDGCKYRINDGRMCAVGCLLRDSEYYQDMEGRNVRAIALPPRLAEHLNLLIDLQRAHDDSVTPQGIRDRLMETAAYINLNPYKVELIQSWS